MSTTKHEFFSERLHEAIKGFSVNGFAKKIAVSEAAIRQYLSGKSEPTRPVIEKIARATRVNLEWLIIGEGPMMRGEGGTGQLDADLKEIRSYEIRASAGPGRFVETEDIAGRHLIDKRFLRQFRLSPEGVIGVFVDGDSMYPTIQDGEVVWLDTTQRLISAEGIYLVRFDDVVMVKRVQKVGDGVLELVSDNKSYRTITVDLSHIGEGKFDVIGRVRMVWKAL